jgi:hypothetical protein
VSQCRNERSTRSWITLGSDSARVVALGGLASEEHDLLKTAVRVECSGHPLVRVVVHIRCRLQLTDQLLTVIVLSRGRRKHVWVRVIALLSVETCLDVSACLQVFLEWAPAEIAVRRRLAEFSIAVAARSSCGRPRPSSSARISALASRR